MSAGIPPYDAGTQAALDVIDEAFSRGAERIFVEEFSDRSFLFFQIAGEMEEIRELTLLEGRGLIDRLGAMVHNNA